MYWKRIVISLVLLATVLLAVGFSRPFQTWWHQPAVLRFPGVVEIQEVRLGSKVGGRVGRVAVVEGQVAEADQPLVYFDVPELEAQRVQQEARLQSAQADLDKARNGYRAEEKEAGRAAAEAARERLRRLRAGPRPEEIRQARAELASAQADLKLAQEKWDRARELYRLRSAPQEEYEAARSGRERAQALLNKAKSYLDLLLAGTREEEIAEAAALFAQARANYDLLLAGTRKEDIAAAQARVRENEGKLREIDANLREAVVRAPERVLVEVVAVRKGDVIAPNQPILRVLRADDQWVKIYVPETQLGKLRLNQAVEVRLDGYPDRVFQGEIMFIASESEFTPRNVQSADERRHQVFGVKVRVADPGGIFKSGMAAEVTAPLPE